MKKRKKLAPWLDQSEAIPDSHTWFSRGSCESLAHSMFRGDRDCRWGEWNSAGGDDVGPERVGDDNGAAWLTGG